MDGKSGNIVSRSLHFLLLPFSFCLLADVIMPARVKLFPICASRYFSDWPRCRNEEATLQSTRRGFVTCAGRAFGHARFRDRPGAGEVAAANRTHQRLRHGGWRVEQGTA